MQLPKTIHPDLLVAQELVYSLIGLTYDKLVQEEESKAYGACVFRMHNSTILFRAAKITPTKIGQFVTLWKRIGGGPIMPFDASDLFDKVIISVRQGQRLGQFVFPKSVLCQQGIISKDAKGGKRAMRVYAPWDITDNQQAKRTQDWQRIYFFEIQPTLEIDQAKKLLV